MLEQMFNNTNQKSNKKPVLAFCFLYILYEEIKNI